MSRLTSAFLWVGMLMMNLLSWRDDLQNHPYTRLRCNSIAVCVAVMNAWVSMSGFTYIKLICGASVSDKNICGVCFEFHAPQIGKRSNVGMWHEFYRCVQEDRKVKNDNMVFVGALFKRPWRCKRLIILGLCMRKCAWRAVTNRPYIWVALLHFIQRDYVWISGGRLQTAPTQDWDATVLQFVLLWWMHGFRCLGLHILNWFVERLWVTKTFVEYVLSFTLHKLVSAPM